VQTCVRMCRHVCVCVSPCHVCVCVSPCVRMGMGTGGIGMCSSECSPLSSPVSSCRRFTCRLSGMWYVVCGMWYVVCGLRSVVC
jgi:hypothetical protein